MKIYIETLGCDKNTLDSRFAAGLLQDAGYEITDDFSEADIVILNTCAFIEDAKKQSIDAIFSFVKAIKAEKNHKKLLVTGCLAQRYAGELEKEIPEIDIILGTNDYARLPELLKAAEKGPLPRKTYASKEKKVFEEFGRRYDGKVCHFDAGSASGSPWSAYIKISEGCDKKCAYCAIPFIRGHYRSRKPENILKEASELAKKGCKELILVAQDTTYYGRDLGRKDLLPELLRKLCKTDGIEWIRLLYCYEEEITPALIEVMRDEPKICKYIDIPLQHYSADVLKSMNRISTPGSIKSTIKELRKQIPGIAIRTTLITGFPGELAEDFSLLYNFVRETRFDRLGVFTYSKEEGTKAALIKPQVRKDVKERRRDCLMRLQKEISLKLNQGKIGTLTEVLVEERFEDGSYGGRTRFDAPEIDNGVIFTSQRELKPGEIVKVRIEDAFDYDLSGRVEES